MDTKIRIKMGDIEVEYEGSESFLKEELRELLAGVVELHKEKGVGPTAINGASNSKSPASDGIVFEGTTNTVAAKLSVNSGPELVIAAVARVALVLGQEKIGRTNLLKEMKTATGYYKQSYGSNLSVSLKNLVSNDRLREVSKDEFSLSATELQKIKATLAN